MRYLTTIFYTLLSVTLLAQRDFLDLSNKRSSSQHLGKSVSYGHSTHSLADTASRTVFVNVMKLNSVNPAVLIADLNDHNNIAYFQLDGYFRRGQQQDLEIPRFRELEHIRYLELRGKELSCDHEDLFKELSLMPNLEYLVLPAYKKLSLDTVSSFTALLKKVKGLNYKDDSVVLPEGLTELSELVLYQKHKTLLASLQNLDKSSIKELKVQTDTINDDILAAIGSFTKLQRLQIEITRTYSNVISRMEHLRKLPDLEKLSMGKLTAEEFEEIGKLENLTQLSIELDTFQTKDISPIFELSKLEELQLSISDSKTLLWNKTAYSSLEKFKVIGRRLEQIGEELGELTSLKELDLKSCKLESLPASTGNLHKLKTLDVRHNELKSLPRSFGGLEKLELLDMAHNSVSHFPESFINLKSLKTLSANNNLLTSLPDGIGELKNMEMLKLVHNKLESIPNSIAGCESLKSLLLSYNLIREIPEDLSLLTKLEVLGLGYNLIKRCPKSIYSMQALQTLYLSNNRLERLPDGISALKSLKTLTLNNSISTTRINERGFSVQLTESEIDSMQKANNNIKQMPTDLWKLPSLSLLNLTGNIEMDDSILQTILKMERPECEVILESCEIKSLPKTGWQNLELKRLDLSKNELTSLPPGLFSTNISDLDLRKNDLGFSDTWIRDLTNLRIYGYLEGAVTKEELLQQPDLVETIMEVGGRKYYYDRENPILEIYPIAFEIDSTKAAGLVDHENYAESLFEAELYDECIPHYTISIVEELAMCMTMVNETYTKFYNRHKAYLETADTTSAIQDLFHIEELLGRFFVITPEVAQLYAEQGKQAEYDKYMDIGIRAYEDRSTDEWDGLRNKLRLLELYIITGEQQKLKGLTKEISDHKLLYGDMKLVFEYLLLVQKIAIGKTFSIEDFKKLLAESEDENIEWRCNLIEKWSANLDQEIIDQIIQLNQAICRD